MLFLVGIAIGAVIVFAVRSDEGGEPAKAQFPFFTVQKDDTITSVLPISEGSRLFVFGVVDGEEVKVTSVSYFMNGESVFSHSDTSEDLTLDELVLKEPPFDKFRIFSRLEDGGYDVASERRHEQMAEITAIYSETFSRVFSGDLTEAEADLLVEQAHERVQEVSEK